MIVLSVDLLFLYWLFRKQKENKKVKYNIFVGPLFGIAGYCLGLYHHFMTFERDGHIIQ